jgi:hypothetical protein
MFSMLFFRIGIDEDVVEVNHNDLVEIFHQDKVHEVREGSGSIGKIRRRDGVLVEATMSGESGLWNVLLSDLYLMEAHPQV